MQQLSGSVDEMHDNTCRILHTRMCVKLEGAVAFTKIRRCCATGRKRYKSSQSPPTNGPGVQNIRTQINYVSHSGTETNPYSHTKQPNMSPSIQERTPSPTRYENDIFALGTDLVDLPEYREAKTADLDFDGLLDPPLIVHEDLAAGCGGMVWPAGRRLAKYMLKMKKEEVQNAESMCVANATKFLCRCRVTRRPFFVRSLR